ncbi:MAG: urea ABC transporter permease subunit UrtB [Xanthobacteraceae bacterium]|nr:urea ABC transporter permease subunit UrtB [Xanthobacteraceae bacterium]
MLLRLFTTLLGVWMALSANVAMAEPAGREVLVAQLCGDAAEMAEGGKALLVLSAGDKSDVAWAQAVASAVVNRQLTCSENGAAAIAVSPSAAIDAVTGVSRPTSGDGRKPVLSLKNRVVFELADAALTLRSAPSVADRIRALRTIERRVAQLPEGVLTAAAAGEQDTGVRDQIFALIQSASLNSPDISKRIAAVKQLAERPNRRVLSQIQALKNDPAYQKQTAFALEVNQATSKVQTIVTLSDVLATAYSGLSYASILFMAAIGLAIIFGLMGVINLAQGEFIMIGAYVTWLTQEALRHVAPSLIDWYLILAIPFAFLVTAGVGVILEAALLRHLYRRPLMSLLASWAVSLFLMNLVRVTFGTQTLQFETPFYITGGVPLIGDFIFTWNRMFAIVFAVVTLAVTWVLIRWTPLGLNIRAVTQNRDMAGCIGIPTRRVDMMAFGLGSGLAGLAGLALSPIFSVNPQMGQNFIIDSFMVVVLGGVGTIAGTVAAAFGIGQINVLIEPLYGAVAAKVIVLTMIIFFLQWRPEGLFAVKGRRK